jgi:hypothetical protein
MADLDGNGQIWHATAGEEDPRDGLGWNGKGLPARPACACP